MSQLSRRAFIATGLGAFASVLATSVVAHAHARARGERTGMPRLAGRLRNSGKSLDEIRAAIDAKFT